MPIDPKEWTLGTTTDALLDDVDEDAAEIVEFFLQNRPEAYSARDVVTAVFDTPPVASGTVTTDDEGNMVMSSTSNEAWFEEREIDAQEILDELVGRNILERRVITTKVGDKMYYRLA